MATPAAVEATLANRPPPGAAAIGWATGAGAAGGAGWTAFGGGGGGLLAVGEGARLAPNPPLELRPDDRRAISEDY